MPEESWADPSTKNVPEQLKQSIGKLIVVNAGETEPARKIHYASSLITHIRSALIYIINSTDQREFSDMLHVMIYSIIKSEFDLTNAQHIVNRIEALFQDKPRTRYDVMLMNDIALVQQCRNNWRGANKVYFENTDAWQKSNEMLADISDILVEVAVRWNLIIIPKDLPFNISQIPNIGFTPEHQQTSPLDE